MNEPETTSGRPTRRTLLRGMGLLAVSGALGLTAPSTASAAVATAATAAGGLAHHTPLSARSALKRLMAGNCRFVKGEMIHPHQCPERRLDVATHQEPFAQVFSCIDSRVPPEVVFDQGLGDLFVIRTGAQTLDELVQGSVEFGPLEYGTPLVVVMGHQRCGAVVAAVESLEHGKDLGPYLNRIVSALKPAYDAAKASSVPKHKLVDATTRWQTTLTVRALEADPRLAPLISAGRLAVQGAYHSLDSGRVTWF
ncbi:carbonic anhydrase [Catenulispora sp. MAP5-51]